MQISVIIPTRNRYDYLELLLNDLKMQEVIPHEVIVVDQSDNPRELINCKQLITDTLGPCVSRNLGVKQATGEVLVFLDDDARIESSFLKEITDPVLNGHFDVCAGAICDPDGNYRTSDADFLKVKNANFLKVITANPDGPKSRITLAFPAGCSAMLKSVFEAVGGFEESFDPTGAGEDREMAIKLYKHGYSIWYNAKAKLLHEVAATGGTRGLGSRSLMIDVHLYRICKMYFSENLANDLKKTILKRYKNNFLRALKSFNKVRTKYRVLQTAKKLLKEE